MKCILDGCEKPRRIRGLCPMHLARFKKYGDFIKRNPPTDWERFEQKFIPEPMSGCWIWIGAIQSGGYSQLSVKNKKIFGHRFSYEFFKGSIPIGLEIDHICRVRCCVNPSHLEAVTRRENIMRGDGPKIAAELIKNLHRRKKSL